jgi:hypothetical protein
MAVARVGFHLAIQVAGFNRAVPGTEPNVTFQALYGNAPVVGVQVNVPVEIVSFDGAVPRLHLEVTIPWHPHLNMKTPGILPPANRPAPMSRHPGAHFDLIPILSRIHSQVLAQLKSLILDPKFDLLGITRRYLDTSVVGVHVHVRPASHRIGLYDFFRARSRRNRSGCRQSGTRDTQPDRIGSAGM